MNRVLASLLIASVLPAAQPRAAEPKPDRLMPFLSRDAVVRESAERFALVERHMGVPPTVVVGRAAPSPRQDSEDRQIRRAATILVEYIQKMSGVKCPVLTDPADGSGVRGPRIFVGPSQTRAESFAELETADAHGFLLTTKSSPHGVDLQIVGASGTGTLYAAWFFLMNYADLRIVMPGEIGEVYPSLERLEVPNDLYVFNPGPDYLLRIWSGQAGFDREAWLADSGGTTRFEYHHNMWRIYDPERFGKTNPEFYPVVQGKPTVPDPKKHSAWQPTFSEPSVAQRAIEYAEEMFTERPHMKSVSLSVNDGGGYSEADIRKGKLLPDGSATISNIYYEYVNTVARAVKKRWPDKYVAFFPYGLAKTPPEFALEDNVMIFLLNEPKTTYAAWKGKVSRIGVYQWLYGMGWVIPNHWPHAMQDYLRWVRAHGGKAFKGEAYVAWAQAGPKMWILNNLLWNVDADVDSLLNDFYQHAYGQKAAPAMARYFAQAEEIYERRRTEQEYLIARWHPGDFQFQHAKPEDFEGMAQSLDEANRLVQGEANKQRVDMVTRCFRWGRYYWQQYYALRRLRQADVQSKEDAEAMLDQAMAFYTLPDERDAYYKEFIATLPQYCVFSQNADNVDWRRVDPMFTWEGFDAAMDQAFGASTAFKKQSMEVAGIDEYWRDVNEKWPRLQPFADTQRLLILDPNAPLRNMMSNGSFEQPAQPSDDQPDRVPIAKDWYVYHNRMVAASVSLDANVKRTGKVSVTAKGMTDYSGLIRWVPVRNRARYRLSFWYRTSPDTRHAFYGIMIEPRVRVHIPPATEWTRVERTFTVNKPRGGQSTFALLLCLRHGGSESSQVWFDDVELQMLAPEGVEAERVNSK